MSRGIDIVPLARSCGAAPGRSAAPRSGVALRGCAARAACARSLIVPLFTIGHSTRSEEELLALLREHNVACLVDVRTVPRSRVNPQWSRERMAVSLPAAGVEYRHMAGLGGLRRPARETRNGAWEVGGFRGFADYALTPAFAVALDELLALAASRPTAIMCAEAVWWRCHRRIITDWVLARGVAVVHILGPGKSEAASLTPFARVERGQVTYPDLLGS